MARTYMQATDEPTQAPLLRWSSVIGGVVIGGALLLLLSALWAALAVATDVQAIADGLGWYLAGSAIVALFVGGMLAAALSGVPGIAPGMLHGLAVWGAILILSAVVGTPGVLGAWSASGIDLPALEAGEALWPTFWGLLIGAATAALGGALGSMMTRGARMPMTEERYGVSMRARHVDDPARYRDERDDERYADERRRETPAGTGARSTDEPYDQSHRRHEADRRYEEDPAVTPSERSYADRSGTEPIRDPRYDERGR